MRLPNGAGSVYKLQGKRRNPWVARKTIGYNDKGQPIYRYIGYFRTKSDALYALTEKTPQNAVKHAPTLSQVFDLYDDRVLSKRTDHYRIKNQSLFSKHLSTIASTPINELSLPFLQEFFNGIESPSTQREIASLIRGLLKEAVLLESLPIGSEAMMRYIEKRPYKAEAKVPFTESEIDTLWNNLNVYGAKEALFLIYTGLRINEFLSLTKITDERYLIIEKSKTSAGKRTIPLHVRILPFAEEMIACDLTYHQFRTNLWNRLMDKLNMNHKIHETRHTFVTRMVEAGCDPRIVKTLTGHSGGNVTDDVYTHISREILSNNVALLR